MKRDKNLVSLSREHHYGLLCVWKIREGVKKNIEFVRIKNYINYFWEHHLQHHFETEDAVFPELQKKSLTLQMENEHRNLEQQIKIINNSNDYQSLLDFADALNHHIRFEERVLFPQYEEELTEEKLCEIGRKIQERNAMFTDNYLDEFWK